ncbi:MAG: hypothetical protein AAF388_29585, partial [Bacteroidota bacterium]
MRKKPSIILLAIAFVILFIQGCFNPFNLADIRPEENSFVNSEPEARKLLSEMGEAHQIHLWDSLESCTVIMEDEFYGFIGNQARPFKESKTSFSLDFIPGASNGKLEILTGKETGMKWGTQSAEVYAVNEDGKAFFKKNKNMKFWIPTYQYFVEFPKRIQEATALEYLGKKELQGTTVEGVLASWGKVEPQKDIDQYLIWIDAETKKIVLIEYTIRDMYSFTSGGAHFKDYKDFHGFSIPTYLPTTSNLVKEGFLHEMRIQDFNI